jgi:hypothetical protein
MSNERKHHTPEEKVAVKSRCQVSGVGCQGLEIRDWGLGTGEKKSQWWSGRVLCWWRPS